MEHDELLQLQKDYKAAVEEWIEAIRAEEALAAVHPTLSQVDKWEAAHDQEEEARKKAKKAKNDYEDAIRKYIFHF
jgi:hypothetical protein